MILAQAGLRLGGVDVPGALGREEVIGGELALAVSGAVADEGIKGCLLPGAAAFPILKGGGEGAELGGVQRFEFGNRNAGDEVEPGPDLRQPFPAVSPPRISRSAPESSEVVRSSRSSSDGGLSQPEEAWR